MNKCAKCGTEFEGKFCPECGTAVSGKSVCPRCGNELKKGAKFCSNCGCNLNEQVRPTTNTATVAVNFNWRKLLRYVPVVLFVLWAVLLWAFYASNVINGDGFFTEDTNLYNVLKDETMSDLFTMTYVLIAVAVIADVYAFAYAFVQWRGSVRAQKKCQIASFVLYLAVIVCTVVFSFKQKEFTEGFDDLNGNFVAVVIALTVVFAFLQAVAMFFTNKFGQLPRQEQIDTSKPRQPKPKMTFGSYPQSEVKDEALKLDLNEEIGNKLPSKDISNGWTDYGYYIDGSVQGYMWYIDVDYQGAKYRGVYFTSYRPRYAIYSSSTSNGNQHNNGYSANTVYWFKWEPITWRILKQENDKALIMADLIIDGQHFDAKYSSIDENTISPNNYAHSDIRVWLNDTFYNTAFDKFNKQNILKTSVDDRIITIANNSKTHADDDTIDNVFLLSYSEVLCYDYGFDASYSAYDTARRLKTTPYAQCQGAYVYSKNSIYKGCGWWWLRSPNRNNGYQAYSINTYGQVIVNESVNYVSNGVVPAMQIRL